MLFNLEEKKDKNSFSVLSLSAAAEREPPCNCRVLYRVARRVGKGLRWPGRIAPVADDVIAIAVWVRLTPPRHSRRAGVCWRARASTRLKRGRNARASTWLRGWSEAIGLLRGIALLAGGLTLVVVAVVVVFRHEIFVAFVSNKTSRFVPCAFV